MPFDLKSTKAKVKDVEKVMELLNNNYFRAGFDFRVDDEGNLEVVSVPGDDSWPRALKRSQMPREEEYQDADEWYEDLREMEDEEGDSGFLSLLRDVGAYLETTLTILAVEFENADCIGRVWIVQPGSGKVETLKVIIG